MSEIFCARLSSGEHIIGKIKENPANDIATSGVIELENALMVNLFQTENGLGVQFLPISPIVKQPLDKGSDISLNLTQVLYSLEFNQSVIDNYKQTVGSIITGSLFTGR